MMRKKISFRKFSDAQIREAVKISYNYSEVLRNLGAGKSGSTLMYFKRRIESLNLDVSHFCRNVHCFGKSPKTKLPFDKILVYNRTGKREKSYMLRRALLESGANYKCKMCGLFQWNNQILTLHVDHINGDPLDNRLDNLRFLCHHCHSQTSNFGNQGKKSRSQQPIKKKVVKKRKRKFEISSKKLQDLIEKMPMLQIGKMFKVSDNAIRKRCIEYGIKSKPRGYWAKKRSKNTR